MMPGIIRRFKLFEVLILISLFVVACTAPATAPTPLPTGAPGATAPAPAAPPAGSQDSATIASRFDENRSMRDVSVLTRPEFMGRHSGTSGETLGAQYLAEQFQAAGLTPGLTDRSFIQEFPMTVTELSSVPELVLANQSGGARSLQLRDDFRPLVGGSAGPGEAQGPGVFAGTGDFSKLDVKGKIALVVPRARLRDLITEAHHAGAVALLITTGEDTLLKGENSEPNAADTLPLFLLSTRGTEALLEGSGRTREDLNSRLRAGQSLEPFPLAFDVRIKVEVETRPIMAKNVIAMQKAATATQDVCIVGAHYEEIGPDPDGVIFPAGNDNASGTAVMLEMARIMAAQMPYPPMNIIYVGWSGHEEGLIGSEYYVNNPVLPLDKTRCYINLDTIGQGEGQNLLAATTSSQIRSAIEASVDELASATGSRPPVEINDRSGGSSDHLRFQNRGISTVDFNWTGIFEGGRIHVPEDDASNVDPQKVKTTGLVATAVLVKLVTGAR